MTPPTPIHRDSLRIGLSGGSPEAAPRQLAVSGADSRTCTTCCHAHPPPEPTGGAWVCMHRTSLIQTTPDFDELVPMYCITVRSSGRPERCGHSGKWWEARE